MASPWKITLRLGPRVVHEHAATLPEALADLRISLAAAAEQAQRDPKPTAAVFREYEPVQQVIARGQLAGPKGVRAGIDVRGDGSSEAWTGRFSKKVVLQQPGEDAYQALERTLTGG